MSTARRHKPLPLDIKLDVIADPSGADLNRKLRMNFEFEFPFKDDVGRSIGYHAHYQKLPATLSLAIIYTYVTRDGAKFGGEYNSACPVETCEAEIYKKVSKAYWRYHRLYSPRSMVLP